MGRHPRCCLGRWASRVHRSAGDVSASAQVDCAHGALRWVEIARGLNFQRRAEVGMCLPVPVVIIAIDNEVEGFWRWAGRFGVARLGGKAGTPGLPRPMALGAVN